MERADHVLAEPVVDTGLAADRRVDLRQQRRRQLHEAHAALVGRGREAGDVADDAAAQRDDGHAAIEACLEHRIVDRFEHRGVLESLAVRHDDRHDAIAERRQGRNERVAVQRRDGLVRDERDVTTTGARIEEAGPERSMGARLAKRSVDDADRIAAFAERDDERRFDAGSGHERAIDGGGVDRQRTSRSSIAFGQAFDEQVDEPRHAAATGLDHEVRDPVVMRFAFEQQRLDPLPRVLAREQRSIAIVARAQPEVVRLRLQIDREPAFLQPRARQRRQHGAAAGREHDAVVAARQLVDDLLLAATESRLAFDLEDGGDRDAGAGLDLVVAVDEVASEARGEQPADGALAGAHHPDDEEVVVRGHRAILCRRAAPDETMPPAGGIAIG